jgi:hypothetical protein
MEMIRDDLAHPSGHVPIDIRIVSWYFYICAVVLGLMAGLYVTAAGQPVGPEPTRVLFGTFVLSSNVSLGVHSFLLAGASLLCAWGIGRRQRFAWWFALIFFTYLALEAASRLMGQSYRFHAFASVCIGMVLLVWLYLRRRLFGVSARGETHQHVSNE